MPLYDYFCFPQNKQFEASHSITTELEDCPLCQESGQNQHKPQRLISRTNFILNGGGWAKEGYSSK
jgi:putative FmdB family regulatory protein